MNPLRTSAQTGGLSGDRVALQVVARGDSKVSIVALGDVPSTVRLGGSVNTPQWEWRPSLSGRWLLFGRIDYVRARYQVLLADLRTGTVRTLDSVSGHAAYAVPGQVNGSWAVWTSCPDNWCRVYRYDIARSTRAPLPMARQHVFQQFGPAVSRTGDVYFGTSKAGCRESRIMKFADAGLTMLTQLPEGISFQYSYLDDSSPERADLYFDRVGCGRSDLSDVYRIPLE
ncbi:MAG: hypothetical protein WKF41_13245 [Gaiellaceae bacterium]